MERGELTVGVLALQGAFREHVHMVRGLGSGAVEVRLPEELDRLDGLIIPGGESTTMGLLMEGYGLTQPLREFAAERPVLGTCAGLIMMAAKATEGNQPLLATMDIVVRRNAFGRQLHSFEAPVDLDIPGLPGDPFPGVFIRAPWVETVGEGVDVIARFEGRVVGVKQGHMIGVAFHPELTDDTRLHVWFLKLVAQSCMDYPCERVSRA